MTVTGTPPTALLRVARRKLRLSNLSGFRAPLRSEDGLLTVRVNALAFVPRNTGNLYPDCDPRFVLSIRAPCHRATIRSCPSPALPVRPLNHDFSWDAIVVLVLDLLLRGYCQTLPFAPRNTGNLCRDSDLRFVLSIRAPCHRATKLPCLSQLSHCLVLNRHSF